MHAADAVLFPFLSISLKSKRAVIINEKIMIESVLNDEPYNVLENPIIKCEPPPIISAKMQKHDVLRLWGKRI